MSHEEGTGSIEAAFQLDREKSLAAGKLKDWQAATLIYADWLEENGRESDAARLRDEASEAIPPVLSDWPDVSKLPRLSDHQREQLTAATRRPLGILCGSPGTGKTHVAAVLATAIPARSLAVTAPTGKAAVRITESILAVNPGTTLRAQTIHQLLGIDRAGYDGGGWQFQHTADNPLPYRHVILDEPSMLSQDNCASLFRALRPGTHLLMVGDPDQLPPVGSGAPLRDLIASEVVPVGRLTEIHRNGGAIAAACAAIRAGKQDEAIGHATVHPFGAIHGSAIAQENPQENWRHIEATSPERCVDVLKQLLGTLAAGRTLPGLCPSVQLLAPVREKGLLSCAAINRLCQDTLNVRGREEKAWGTRIRVGDRVVCLHNHQARLDTNTMATQYVANGELGVVMSVNRPIVGAFGDNLIRMSTSEDDAFGLGYCLTGHKSQGSEWPVTIVLLDSWAGRNVMGREWVYTVLSRARRLCITIGRLWSVRQAVADRRLEVRRTFLDSRLREAVLRG